ncbi:S26 family signal peptidase [Micromonospora sp. NPDC004551]|uniref:S26 family signal peptidase n=1 Tax=Micromonospora sp. NPDC004551 TaxID=3154284 RepID=UPI0033AD0113
MTGAALTGALAAVGLLGAGWWLRRRYVTVTVDGESMLPTYRPGERLLVRRVAAASLRTGQVVVLSRFGRPRPAAPVSRDPAPGPPQWIIKRVAAVPGDPIPRDTVAALRGAPGTRVPDGRVVVLGDNPPRSLDSRQTGYVTTDRLLGVVLRRLR